MVVYKAFLKVWAAYQIAAEPPRARSRLHGKIHGLMIDPRPEAGTPLAGYTNLWRITLGPYRMVYSIDDENRSVTIIAIGYRHGRPHW